MTRFQGFTQEDFDTFAIEGLDPRMDAIKSRVRPKLETLGEILAPRLSAMVGDEMFYHVAKHARRTVNPPDDTWVAWAADKRGYKKHPHFQVGMWNTHLFAWFALIYESPNKPTFGAHLQEQLPEIRDHIPDDFVWSSDHTKPEAAKHGEMSEQDFQKLTDRLQKVKKSEALCGIHIDRHDPVLQNGDELIKRVETTFERLLPLYRLAF